MIGLDLLGVTTATSDIKWSDGKYVVFGTPVYDSVNGRGVIAELVPSDVVAKTPPRVTIKWDRGGSISWETSTISAKYRDAPELKAPVASSTTRPADSAPIKKMNVAGLLIGGAVLTGVGVVGFLWWRFISRASTRDLARVALITSMVR